MSRTVAVPSQAGNPMRARWALALCASASLLIVSATPAHLQPLGCPAPPLERAFEPEKPNLGLLKLQLLQYRCSKYDEELRVVLSEAGNWIKDRAGAVSKPAVVLDVDETSLSNWERIYRNDFGYVLYGACDTDQQTACGSRAWELSVRAVAIQPTLELFNLAKTANTAVFFITSRDDDQVTKAATEFNLRREGYIGWDGLFLRPTLPPRPSASEFKTSVRKRIVEEGYTIIANIGDQDSDLTGGYAERPFKLPNPFYFIP
jgi:HAD superfamily, subfamily IIIB (Acid phosphatase)